ncbi:MAG: single-stranded-DNA-specific exonuclease RecJ [Ignavibacteriales bacterium]|nr:single-stranded-DNA-specific exonuclease RecJ [Ignavibacteriales bacterium]
MSPIKEYRWTLRSDTTVTPEITERVQSLSQELSISPVLTEILVSRGIDTFEKARTFFRPSMEDLHDPFIMDHMDAAVKRISLAVFNNEHMIVFGDYDVDGTDSTAMLWKFLKDAGANVSYFIPDRIKDGYGISTAGIDHVRDAGATLLIAVDCGITAVQQVEYARSYGIDIIICDHHEPGNEIPNATAVLDALKPSCSYPFKYLCGCGVAFKLIQALATSEPIRSKFGEDAPKRLLDYLQYVTLATTADIVPLVNENRVMVKLGLELMNSIPVPGIRALIETSGLSLGRISSGQIVFVLAPRINAVGRLGDANRAVEMLASDSYDRAVQIARVMEDENFQRRKIDEETFLQAQEIVEKVLEADNDSAIVLHQEAWHPGVIGIVASRLVERYYRPTIMMTTVDGVAKGSARSISGFNIHEALKRCEDKLIQFGGHKYAAGLTVELDRLDEFRDAFKQVAAELLTEELLTPEIKIDAELQLSDLTPKFIRVLNQFAPFGPENMRPVFAARNVEVLGQPRIVGKNHLRFKVRSNTHIVDAIGFNLGHLLSRVRNGSKVDVVFSLDEGEFAGETVPQLKIRDVK